jgi:hypothetical protein
MNDLDATGPYIWLRYATQFSKDGQIHTIEMSIPIPLGASPERREELIREAEAGMNQLGSRFGHRSPQMPQRVQDPQVEYGAAPPSAPMQKSVPPQQPRNKPTAVSAPQITSRPPDGLGREGRPMLTSGSSQEPVVPPTRPNVGASMPMTLGPILDSSGNLPLPEFIQYIHENLNLTPRQAMEMLKVKSLSTGVNLREALERLRYLVAQKNANPIAQLEGRIESESEPEQSPVRHESVVSSALASRSTAETHTQQSSHTPDDQTSPERGSQQEERQPQIIEMRVPTPVRFDEEEDPEIEEELEDLHLPPAFTAERAAKELEYARSKINELRESQGASVASPKRLQALGNVIGDQISQEQLQNLIDGIWSVSALKKLKMDQVEALISWAKQDDFIEEVEAALAVLEEDRYARGNR